MSIIQKIKDKFSPVKEKADSVVGSKKYITVTCTNALLSMAVLFDSALNAGLSVAAAGEDASDLTNITSAITTVTSIMTSIWNFMIGNPLMCCYMGIGLAAAGAGLLKKFRRTSR